MEGFAISVHSEAQYCYDCIGSNFVEFVDIIIGCE